MTYFLDFVLEKGSPLNLIQKKYSLGTKSNPVNFNAGLNIILTLLKRVINMLLSRSEWWVWTSRVKLLIRAIFSILQITLFYVWVLWISTSVWSKKTKIIRLSLKLLKDFQFRICLSQRALLEFCWKLSMKTLRFLMKWMVYFFVWVDF